MQNLYQNNLYTPWHIFYVINYVTDNCSMLGCAINKISNDVVEYCHFFDLTGRHALSCPCTSDHERSTCTGEACMSRKPKPWLGTRTCINVNVASINVTVTATVTVSVNVSVRVIDTVTVIVAVAWQEAASVEKFADCAIICTQDQHHKVTVLQSQY